MVERCQPVALYCINRRNLTQTLNINDIILTPKFKLGRDRVDILPLEYNSRYKHAVLATIGPEVVSRYL